MPNWKNAAEYEFEDKRCRERWVWEFLRRNPDYIADYKTVSASVRQERLTGNAPRSKKFQRLSVSPHAWGARWRINGPIHDPACNDFPKFRLQLPEMPSPYEVLGYFASPSEEEPDVSRPQYAVLAFRIDTVLAPQIIRAQKLLKREQKRWKSALPKEREKKTKVRRSFTPGTFQTFLRVLDAKAVKASTKEILKYIDAYEKVREKAGADHGFQGLKRIGRDQKKGDDLVADPWVLLEN